MTRSILIYLNILVIFWVTHQAKAEPVVTSTVSVVEVETSSLTPSSVPEGVGTEELRTEKRLKPRLDGREPKGPTAKEVLIWIPRVLFAPVHLVFEWGIRKPLGAILTAAERDNWSDFIIDFFTFEDRKIGVVPTFFYDFNFRPSVGIFAFWDELFVKPHSIRLIGGYGGEDWYRVTFLDQWDLGKKAELSFGFNLWGRPDNIFAGIGLEGDPDLRSRYFHEFIDGTGQFVLQPWRRSEIRFEAGVRRFRFRTAGSAGSDEQTLRAALENGVFAQTPGGLDGYFANFQRLLVRIDTRKHRPAPGTGLLIEPYLNHGWDMENPDLRRWLGYGGRAAGFVDLGQHRVLGLTGQTHFVNAVGDRADEDIPFTELFILGRRPQDLSGFLPGTLRGQSAAIFTLEYTYPIWVYLDGALHVSVGNAFGKNLEGFNVERFRGSIGLGIQSSLDEDNAFTFLVALGTSRFDERFAIDSVRFVVGTQAGF